MLQLAGVFPQQLAGEGQVSAATVTMAMARCIVVRVRLGGQKITGRALAITAPQQKLDHMKADTGRPGVNRTMLLQQRFGGQWQGQVINDTGVRVAGQVIQIAPFNRPAVQLLHQIPVTTALTLPFNRIGDRQIAKQAHPQQGVVGFLPLAAGVLQPGVVRCCQKLLNGVVEGVGTGGQLHVAVIGQMQQVLVKGFLLIIVAQHGVRHRRGLQAVRLGRIATGGQQQCHGNGGYAAAAMDGPVHIGLLVGRWNQSLSEMIGQPRRSASALRVGSGSTATGLLTSRSSGRSLRESL